MKRAINKIVILIATILGMISFNLIIDALNTTWDIAWRGYRGVGTVDWYLTSHDLASYHIFTAKTLDTSPYVASRVIGNVAFGIIIGLIIVLFIIDLVKAKINKSLTK